MVPSSFYEKCNSLGEIERDIEQDNRLEIYWIPYIDLKKIS